MPESLEDLPEDADRINIGSGLLWSLSRESKPELEEVIGLDVSSEKARDFRREGNWSTYFVGELEEQEMPFVSGDKTVSEADWAADEPLRRVFSSDQYQRLSGVNQHGPWGRLAHDYPVDRAEHSVGVVNLLRRQARPHMPNIREQLAASLHDIGHGPFSHFAEDVLEVLGEDVSYEFHEEMAHQRLDEPYTGEEGDLTLNERLLEVGFDGHQILNDYNPEEGESEFPLLEKEKPDICADRWEYFIRDTAFLALNEDNSTVAEWSDLVSYDKHLDVANPLEKYVNQDNDMVSTRVSDQRQFVMTDPEVATQAARDFMQMNQEYWWSPVNRAQSRGYAFAAAEAIEEAGIGYDDFFRFDDAEAYDFIDENAGNLLSDVERYFTQENIQVVDNEEEADFTLDGCEWEGEIDPQTGDGYSKSIDPLVKEDEDQSFSEMKRASEYDEDLREEIERHEEWAAEDQHIKVEGFDFERISEYV